MTLLRAPAKLSALAASKFVVGSSKARMPHDRQKVSARANLMTRQANTCIDDAQEYSETKRCRSGSCEPCCDFPQADCPVLLYTPGIKLGFQRNTKSCTSMQKFHPDMYRKFCQALLWASSSTVPDYCMHTWLPLNLK